jgi:TonB family protein
MKKPSVPRLTIIYSRVFRSIRTLSIITATLLLSSGHANAQSPSSSRVCSGDSTVVWSDCIGTSRLPNGNIYQGEWNGGQRTGWGVEYDKSGRIVFEGYWSQGLPRPAAAPGSGPEITTTTTIPPPITLPPALRSNSDDSVRPRPLRDVRPTLLLNECLRLEYPRQALRFDVQGITTVNMFVEIDGSISDVVISGSSGPHPLHKVLDNTLVEAVKKCRGRPGTVNGEPARLQTLFDYVWRIEGAEHLALYARSRANAQRAIISTERLEGKFAVGSLTVNPSIRSRVPCGRATAQISPDYMQVDQFIRYAFVQDYSSSSRYDSTATRALTIKLEKLDLETSPNLQWSFEAIITVGSDQGGRVIRSRFAPTNVGSNVCSAAERSFPLALRQLIWDSLSQENIEAVLMSRK